MRIVIDMQSLQTGSRLRGIGQYSINLVKALINNNTEHEIIIVLNGLLSKEIIAIRQTFSSLLPDKSIKIWYADGPTNDSLGTPDKQKNAQLIRESFLKDLQPDFVLLTTLFEGYHEDCIISIHEYYQDIPTATIFYDLIPLLFQDTYLQDPKIKTWYHKKVKTLKKSDLLLAISNAARDEAITLLELNPDKVVNISADTNDLYRPIDIPIAAKQHLYSTHGIKDNFILYTSSPDARKNHVKLIEAYAKLPQHIIEKYQLVFIGGMHHTIQYKFRDIAKKCGLYDDRLILTNRISDDAMLMLYNLATLFVFPSLHEGFGLPALEAMRCHTPVIGSNVSSLPEVIGYDEALFDPEDSTSIAAKIEEVLTDKVFYNTLTEHAKKQKLKFNWDTSARIVFESLATHMYKPHSSLNTEMIKKQLIQSIHIPDTEQESNEVLKYAYAINKTFPNKKKKQLFIDVSELILKDAKTGIQRVVRNVLHELLLSPPKGYNVEAVYANYGEYGYKYARKFQTKFLGNSIDEEIDDEMIEIAPNDVFLGLDMSHDIQIFQQQYYNELREYGIKVFFIIYDLLPVKNPQWWTESKIKQTVVKEKFEEWLEMLTTNDGVICISDAVANEFSDWIEEKSIEIDSSFQISTSHIGADLLAKNNHIEISTKENIFIEQTKNTLSFLVVGTLEPRKAHAHILSAFELLWKQDIDVNLIIVGKVGWLTQALVTSIQEHPKLDKNLFWLQKISDNYLNELYKNATALMIGSYAEGFGLPLIEAAQYEIPVIARDIPVFHEIAKEFAFYFPNTSEPKILADSIKEWMTLYSQDKHPKSSNIPWLTWKECASQIVQLLHLEQNKS